MIHALFFLQFINILYCLAWKDPLEKEMSTQSRILAWRIPWTVEPGRLQSIELQRVGHHWNNWASLFKLERTLESPLDCKEIKPVNSKGNQPWIFIGRTNAEVPLLWPTDAKSRLMGKNSDTGKDWRLKEKGTAEEEMVRLHQWLKGHEFEQTPGESEKQGSLECCSPWGHKE